MCNCRDKAQTFILAAVVLGNINPLVGDFKRLFKLVLGSFSHTFFMTLPPIAILVFSHLICLLVLLRMDGNIACLLIQFSYI